MIHSTFCIIAPALLFSRLVSRAFAWAAWRIIQQRSNGGLHVAIMLPQDLAKVVISMSRPLQHLFESLEFCLCERSKKSKRDMEQPWDRAHAKGEGQQ